jgi:formate hydrogenlyase subunit 6/NADH:ubiquinone oxidoreductase subunit I
MSATFYTVLFSFTKIAAEGLPPLSHQNLISVNNGLIENLHEIFDAQIWKRYPRLKPLTQNRFHASSVVCRLSSVVCCLSSVVCRL